MLADELENAPLSIEAFVAVVADATATDPDPVNTIREAIADLTGRALDDPTRVQELAARISGAVIAASAVLETRLPLPANLTPLRRPAAGTSPG